MSTFLLTAYGLTLHGAPSHSPAFQPARSATPFMNAPVDSLVISKEIEALREKNHRLHMELREIIGTQSELDAGIVVPTGTAGANVEWEQRYGDTAVVQSGGRNAKDIFMAGLENLKAEPRGWFFGKPSPLYSNQLTDDVPYLLRTRPIVAPQPATQTTVDEPEEVRHKGFESKPSRTFLGRLSTGGRRNLTSHGAHVGCRMQSR